MIRGKLRKGFIVFEHVQKLWTSPFRGEKITVMETTEDIDIAIGITIKNIDGFPDSFKDGKYDSVDNPEECLAFCREKGLGGILLFEGAPDARTLSKWFSLLLTDRQKVKMMEEGDKRDQVILHGVSNFNKLSIHYSLDETDRDTIERIRNNMFDGERGYFNICETILELLKEHENYLGDLQVYFDMLYPGERNCPIEFLGKTLLYEDIEIVGTGRRDIARE